MNICEHLTATARLFPDRAAIVFEGKEFTYAQLDQLSVSAAAHLVDAGICPGDRVAIMLPNVPAFVVWYYAALRIGAIAVAVSTRQTLSEVAHIVADCGAKAIVASDSLAHDLQTELSKDAILVLSTDDNGDSCNTQSLQAAPGATSTWFDADPNDAACILYTSGTTGYPKGATLSHMNVRSNVHAFNHLCHMQSTDRILLAVPLFHCFGQNALLNSALNVGATLVLQERFELGEARRLIRDHRITQLYGVPMMFQLFYDSCSPADLSSVQYCFSAAAKLPIRTSQRWQDKFGMPIHEGYGLTETSPFASYNHRLQFVPGSIGTPIDSVEMKIVDMETGANCPPGKPGEIAIRGPNVMLGYWNRPLDTAEVIRGGWFYSGDIGHVDERGFFYIVDRVKDMIAVGGLKVYPAEVERVLLDDPVVSEAAVVGFPDDVSGEKVVAFLVLDAKTTPVDVELLDGILQRAKRDLASYKLPRHLVPIEELPRNPSGKVLKTRLRGHDMTGGLSASNGDSPRSSNSNTTMSTGLQGQSEATLRKLLDSTHAAGRRDVVTRFVQDLVQTLTHCDELPGAETRFLDAGLDSLMIVEMSSRIQAEIGSTTDISSTVVFDYPRICDLSEFLEARLAADDSTVTDDAALPAPRADRASLTTTGVPALRHQIESMTEDQALLELLQELED